MIKIEIEKVLIEYLEPLLLLVKSSSGKRYLSIAIEVEGENNQFLSVRILDNQIESLISSEMDVKSIFVKPYGNIWYMADIKEVNGKLKKYKDNIWDVPTEYLPGPGLFVPFEELNESDLSQIDSRKLAIDGNWTPTDFQQVARSYNQIYSMAYLLENGSSDAISNKVIDHPYRDGFSSMHLHRELLSDIPPWFRPRVQEVRYASPGFIKFRGQNIALDYFLVVSRIIKNNYAALFKSYSEAHKYLSDNNLLGKDVSEYNDDYNVIHGISLESKFNGMCRALEFKNQVLEKFQGANKLAKVKYLLVYIRRIDELRELIFSEKISIE